MDRDSDSTVTSMDENTNSTSDILASGIIGVFKPIIENIDERVLSTKQTQEELKAQLDLLASELREIEKTQATIPEFSEKVKELINIKHKVTVIANILTNSQERLKSLHEIIDKEESRRKALLQSALNTNVS